MFLLWMLSLPLPHPRTGNKVSLQAASAIRHANPLQEFLSIIFFGRKYLQWHSCFAGCHTYCSSTAFRSFGSHVLPPASFIRSSLRFILPCSQPGVLFQVLAQLPHPLSLEYCAQSLTQSFRFTWFHSLIRRSFISAGLSPLRQYNLASLRYLHLRYGVSLPQTHPYNFVMPHYTPSLCFHHS